MINLLKKIRFTPKENAKDIFIKKYNDGYVIEIDFDKKTFYFGGKIKIQGKDFQNITKPEDWVVLECVNRLLERGYSPENIQLEKVYPAGLGFSGRLDICVTREDGSEYLLIECKTYGKEFEKEITRMKKDGGQLFTYFKFSNKADVIMLYASEFNGKELNYMNEIVKIVDEYRIGDVKDFYNCWDKITYKNLVWQNPPYNSEIKKTFTKNVLEELTKSQSDTIFHGFASILRKHSVSDKPNAFNKIFNLFLAKLFDEAKGNDMELEFHWREDDNPIDFQVRLINLHKKGLEAFLAKEIAGIEDSDFAGYKNAEELLEKKKKVLMFNNVFAIKEVDDEETFNNNHRVLKEVVKLLENYQIRYPRKQQHLSDFFELLLTTGLKQEVGQYFTPPPVTKFIARSLPIKQMILQDVNNENPKLPAVIDYAAGSGHFVTEALEEYQDIINNIDIEKELTFPNAKKAVKSWIEDPYNWAAKYVYGIEKDYRLVKVAKVGCYFYGDGVAQIIHGDGLDSFATSKTYKGLLKENINIEDSSKAKFSVVISNPPYAVNDCKDDLEYIGAQHEYTLYNSLSDKSKDIECLFVERTKHLLKDGGVASLILPSSILNNTGIQTKTREIILQYFDIIAIAEFGSNTFMATGTNTVTLFLRRRANKLSNDWKKSVADLFERKEDITINGIEKPLAKYVKHVWQNISFTDYISMLEKTPNQAIQHHEIYKEYRKKLKAKTEKDFWNVVLDREADKLFYFIITLNQKVVLVKSGEKEVEKRFLGYEFSSRRGGEGMHAMQRDKTVDECTQLYDAKVFDNPEKASTYILKAFTSNDDFAIDAKMQNHVSQHDLVDMLTFDRVEFEKTISLNVKKKVKFESKWEIAKLSEVAQIDCGNTNLTKSIFKDNGQYDVYSAAGLDGKTDFFEQEGEAIILSAIGARCGKCFYASGKWTAIKNTIVIKNKSNILLNYLFEYINNEEFWVKSGTAQPFITMSNAYEQKIPLPPLEIQQKIVSEIEVLEAKEKKAKEEVEKLKREVVLKTNNFYNLYPLRKLGLLCDTPMYGANESATNGNPKTDYRYIRITDINDDGSLNNDWKTAEKVEEKYILKNGDILFARSGATAGKSFIYNEKYGKAIFAGYLIKFTVKESLISFYLNFILKSENYQKWVLQNRIGTAQPNINAQQYSSFEIPLPPLSEQQKIVSEIEKIEEKINLLETDITSIVAQKEAILKKYL